MDPGEVLLIHQVLGDLEEAEMEAAQPRRDFHLRHRINPFEELSELKFRKYFRVSKELARRIIEIVTPFIQLPTRMSAISVEQKVLVALKFYGFGSYQEITGGNKYLSLSQSSVSRCIHEVSEALNQPNIFDQWIHFPRTMEELRQMRHRFFEKYQFPGIIGIIDCTHVAIVRPKTEDPEYPEHIYVNRKQYHSINVQLICDENLRITNVNARFPGSNHDAHIWRQSNASRALERIYRHNPNDAFFLLGDSGYPLRPYLLTPIQNPEPETPESRFNDRFTSIRSIIERVNGVLKNRFRCLLRHRVLHYPPPTASKIINACCVLHNMCIDYNVPEPDYDEEMEGADLGIYQPINIGNVVQNNDLHAARMLRHRIVTNFFN